MRIGKHKNRFTHSFFGFVLVVIAIIIILNKVLVEEEQSYSTQNPYPGRTIAEGWPVWEGKCIYPSTNTYFREIDNLDIDESLYEKNHRVSSFDDLEEPLKSLIGNLSEISKLDELDPLLGNVSYFENDAYVLDLIIENVSVWEQMTSEEKFFLTNNISKTLASNLMGASLSPSSISVLGYICNPGTQNFERDVFLNRYDIETEESEVYLDWEN